MQNALKVMTMKMPLTRKNQERKPQVREANLFLFKELVEKKEEKEEQKLQKLQEMHKEKMTFLRQFAKVVEKSVQDK